MKKIPAFLLSRNYVEFGPFSAEELSTFHSRGILLESDYVKESGGHVWSPLSEWRHAQKPALAATEATKAAPKKKAAKPKSAA